MERAFGSYPIHGKPTLLLRPAFRNLLSNELDDGLGHVRVLLQAEKLEPFPQVVRDSPEDHRSHAIMIAYGIHFVNYFCSKNGRIR